MHNELYSMWNLFITKDKKVAAAYSKVKDIIDYKNQTSSPCPISVASSIALSDASATIDKLMREYYDPFSDEIVIPMSVILPTITYIGAGTHELGRIPIQGVFAILVNSDITYSNYRKPQHTFQRVAVLTMLARHADVYVRIYKKGDMDLIIAPKCNNDTKSLSDRFKYFVENVAFGEQLDVGAYTDEERQLLASTGWYIYYCSGRRTHVLSDRVHKYYVMLEDTCIKHKPALLYPE